MEIVANQTDTQREGRITIKFPQDEQKNQIINLRQKSLADRNAIGVPISEGYGRYGVGYGYDGKGIRRPIRAYDTHVISRAHVGAVELLNGYRYKQNKGHL